MYSQRRASMASRISGYISITDIDSDTVQRTLVLVQDLEHAPQADPVAVVAAAIAQHVGMRHARPRIAHPHLGREVFVMLDVGADPDRDPRAVGPGKLRSLDDGE